ncbi:MAG: IucA/IucC family protein [Litoreibacter sp.]
MSIHETLTLETVEDRVLRQLCEALIFEGLCSVRNVGTELEWTLTKTNFRSQLDIGGFDRPRIHPGSITVQIDDLWHPAKLDDVLNVLPADAELRSELRDDLSRTAFLTNLTRPIVQQRGSRIAMTYDQLECAIDEGHPYHPCFKARSGFSDADHLAFGPEAAETFQLEWLAVDKGLIAQMVPDGFWRKELGERNRLKLCRQATAAGINLSEFGLIPAHPWQTKALQTDPIYRAWIETRKVVPLGPVGDRYRATQSVRTLANVDDPTRAHVKTSMAMRNTSSLRTIEPHSVCIAAAISNWLAKVVDSDPLFETDLRFTILPEYAGIIAARETPLAGHLAVLYRQSPQGCGLASDQIMPFNALSLLEADGQPFIHPWVQKHGLRHWLDQLLRVTILPIWHLMVAHGIGLEAHAQNLMLEHDDGWPIGLVARDFHESLEYVPELLSQPELVPDLAAVDPIYSGARAGAFHLMPSAEALRELVMDTLFIYNLAELASLLHRHYAVPEPLFWKKVRGILDEHVAQHGLQARQDLFAPFTPQIFTESLMTLKLNGGEGVFQHSVSNPLNLPKG